MLRFGLPIDNKEARDIQLAVENVKNNIKARRIGFAKGDVGNAKKILNSNKAKLIAAAASAGHEAAGKAALEKFAADIEPLAIVLSSEGSFGTFLQLALLQFLQLRPSDHLARLACRNWFSAAANSI